MCPLCIASAALIAAGAIPTGGLTALVVKKLGAKSTTKEIIPEPKFPESKFKENRS